MSTLLIPKSEVTITFPLCNCTKKRDFVIKGRKKTYVIPLSKCAVVVANQILEILVDDVKRVEFGVNGVARGGKEVKEATKKKNGSTLQEIASEGVTRHRLRPVKDHMRRVQKCAI